MTATGLVALYVSLWALALLLVLPFAAKPHAGDEPPAVKGQDGGAPARFDPRHSFFQATVLGSVMFALVLINQHFGWITPAMLDVTGGAH